MNKNRKEKERISRLKILRFLAWNFYDQQSTKKKKLLSDCGNLNIISSLKSTLTPRTLMCSCKFTLFERKKRKHIGAFFLSFNDADPFPGFLLAR